MSLATTASLAARPGGEAVADLLYRIVEATEQRNPRLRRLDYEIKRIDELMKNLYFSEGWDLEIISRQTETEADRHERRSGWTRRTDGTNRRAYDLTGTLDENDSELVIRLRRSFLARDHEKYVKIALQRLGKMDAVIRKQELRREIHLATLEAILDVLYRQAVLPLVDQQIDQARRQVDLHEVLHKAGEALRKDLLETRHKLSTMQEQRQIHRDALQTKLRYLRREAGNPNLSVPVALPLADAAATPPVVLDEQELTSLALLGRTEFMVASRRVRLADTLATYMAWYWPKLDFEIWWGDYHGHRRWLDEHRRDKGNEFGYELSLTVPLYTPLRGWARHKEFRAAQRGFEEELEALRARVEDEVYEAYVLWRQAHLHGRVAHNRLAVAREAQREIDLLAQQLPERIQGVSQVKRIRAHMDVGDARLALYTSNYESLLAQARLDYLVGDSPIDRATAPYEEQDRRAVEKRGWLQWWTSLIK